MSNRVINIQAVTDRGSQLEVKVFTTEYSIQIHVSENCQRTFEGEIILGTGVKKVSTIYLNKPFALIRDEARKTNFDINIIG